MNICGNQCAEYWGGKAPFVSLYQCNHMLKPETWVHIKTIQVSNWFETKHIRLTT